MLSVRDPFLREWNDLKNAVSESGLWHVILLATVVFNLPFGPWDGAAWFCKMRDMAIEMSQSVSPSNPLFTAFYQLLCFDNGFEPLATPEHCRLVFEKLFTGEAFTVKGVRVSLRRWFGWMEAAHQYLPLWHSRLFAIISIGQSLGIYKHFSQVPLWSSSTRPPLQASDVPDDDDDPAGDDDEAVDADAGVFQGASAAAAASTAVDAAAAHATATEDHAPTTKKSGTEELKNMRATLGNTMFVCGGILAKDNIRSQVTMILEIGRPIYTRHASNARDARGAEAVNDYYQKAALGDFMVNIEECARVFLDMPKLHCMGFITDFAVGLNVKKLTVASEIVQAQSTNAFHLLDLFVRLAFHRVTSMMYHTHGQGYSALLGSSDDAVYDQCVAVLVRDFLIFLDIKDRAMSQSPFLIALIRRSPFRLRFMHEIMLMLTLPLC